MGCHFSSKLHRGKSSKPIQAITMNKFVAYSCLAAVACAAPSPDADAWGIGYGAPLAAAHVAVAPAPAAVTITTPKCTLTYEEIETQNCVPKVENVCDTVDVEKECKDVTSKVCGPNAGAIPIIKREAEAEPWLGLAGHAIGAPYVHHAPALAPALAPAALAHGYATIKSDCREVTKEVCVNTPKKISKSVPITTCKVVQSVDCTPVVSKVPKQNCEAVETEVPVAPALPAHPVAAGIYGAGYGLW